jgi:hypothetical protein
MFLFFKDIKYEISKTGANAKRKGRKKAPFSILTLWHGFAEYANAFMLKADQPGNSLKKADYLCCFDTKAKGTYTIIYPLDSSWQQIGFVSGLRCACVFRFDSKLHVFVSNIINN